MHALLAHAYHLSQYGLHVLLLPLWRPPFAALGIAAAGRITGVTRTRRGAALTVCGAALAGWMLLNPDWSAWPLPPVARLPGLALILLAEAWLLGAAKSGAGLMVTLGAAALSAWWLRGGPTSVLQIVTSVPVFLGLAAALPLARRLGRGDNGRGDDGRGSAAAALVLAAGIVLAGASGHWAGAAVVPAVAAIVLLGVAEASFALAGAVVVVAASTIVASDRGRILPVDVACLAPLLAWPLAARASRWGHKERKKALLF